MDAANFEPGWYPSPGERDVLRWWDGARWTDDRCARAGAVELGRTRWPRWATALAVVGALALPFVLLGSFILYAKTSGDAHDVLSLDDVAIRDAASNACAALVPVLTSEGTSRIDAIRAGNQAIEDLVVSMNALGHERLAADRPALDWIVDWESLATERKAFADRLEAGSTSPFEVPMTDDGYPITKRMKNVAPFECTDAVDAAAGP